MGITCKKIVGKFRGALRRIENEQFAEKKAANKMKKNDKKKENE